MLIYAVPVGELETNCYLVADEKTKETLIIDPGDEAEKISRAIEAQKLKPVMIVNTHGHYDHQGANRIVKEKYNIPLLIHEKDTFGLAIVGSPVPDRYLKDNDHFEVGSLKFEVVHSPGHTPGGICLYNEKENVLFSGDTLFQGTWGRTDLPYSSEKEMAASLKKLLVLPPETKVYPGHGAATTISAEQGLLNEL